MEGVVARLLHAVPGGAALPGIDCGLRHASDRGLPLIRRFAPPSPASGRRWIARQRETDEGMHTRTVSKVLKSLFQHPLTEKGIASFLSDWAKTGQKI
jgi:hypothetical protein